MKFLMCISLLCLAACAAALEDDAGHFIPRAFYTLDAQGHKSELHFVHPNTANYLRRLRRSASSTSSSSSSTVTASDDGPVYFSSSQTTQHTSEPAASGSGTSSSQRTAPKTRGQTVQTVGMVDKNGRLHARVTHGNF